MSKTIVDSFIIGGTMAGPSRPGPRLQNMIGTRILIYPMYRKMQVPTPDGPVFAGPGDCILLYDDDTLEVDHAKG